VSNDDRLPESLPPGLAHLFGQQEAQRQWREDQDQWFEEAQAASERAAEEQAAEEEAERRRLDAERLKDRELAAKTLEHMGTAVARLEALQTRIESADAERRKLAWRDWVLFAAAIIAAVAGVIALFVAGS
jgi:hypothetical protein